MEEDQKSKREENECFFLKIGRCCAVLTAVARLGVVDAAVKSDSGARANAGTVDEQQ
jgi:hypothetical protein